MVEKDTDYYCFWAEEFYGEHEDELIEIVKIDKNEQKLAIRISHILMDEGHTEDYQEDGARLAEVIINF